MSTRWRCAVCEGVNEGGRTCATCGAELSRTAALSRDVRGEVLRRAPAVPVERARPVAYDTRVDYGDEHGYDAEAGWDVRPIPGGCLVSSGGGRRRRRRRR